MSKHNSEPLLAGWPSWSRRALLGSFAAASVYVAMAGAAVAQDVQFWHYQTFGNQRALQQMVSGFEKEAGVKVRETSKPASELYSAAIAAAAIGRGPDVMQVFTRNVPAMVTMMKAVPLDGDAKAGAWLGNYLASFLAMGTYEGKVYGAPHSLGTPLLYYNKDLFRKAGLDADKPPRTWADVVSYAKQIQAKTGKSGVTLVHDSLDYGANTMLMGNQSRMLSDDGKRVAFDDARGIEAMQLWQDMVVKDKIHPTGEANAMRSAFESGELGMRTDTSALLGRFVRATKGRFELGVAEFPTWGDRPRSVPNSGSVLMVFAPEGPRRDNALKLVQYLSRPEISNEWARVSGYMPVARDPLADPKMAAFYKENPDYLPALKQMKDTVPVVVWPAEQAGEISVRLKNMVDALWLDKAPAPQIVHETAAGINKLLADGK